MQCNKHSNNNQALIPNSWVGYGSSMGRPHLFFFAIFNLSEIILFLLQLMQWNTHWGLKNQIWGKLAGMHILVTANLEKEVL